MTSGIGFYAKPKVFRSNSFEDDDLFGNEEDDENIANQGYMYEVPYTSSSVDRSSIGSIPWADDAIKINKMEWEKVENLLSGLEPLSDADEDLRKEILDWQSKFPQILNKNQHQNKTLRSDTLDVESLPSFELRSYDEDYETEGNTTLTRKYNAATQPQRKSSEEETSNLCQLMDNFTLKPVPFKISQRESIKAVTNKRNCTSSTSSYSLRTPTPPKQVPVVSTSNNGFRMPPILNVLETRKKFRSLGQNKNPSFVQLTQIQQTKSAAVTQEQKSWSRFLTGHRSAWHVPFVANRFSNRNSIILPSIAPTPTTSSTTSEIETLNVKPSFNVTRSNILRGLTHNSSSKHQVTLGGSTTNASTQTNTTSGRSISAAVKYPRVTTYNALYLPYSASKFHAFH